MSAIPDLTPPGKSEKPAKAPKSLAEFKGEEKPKKEKVAKAPKPEKDPSAPKAPRAARQDYGYRADATIGVVKDKDVSKLRGQRKAWHDKIVAFDGKKVSEFTEANKDNAKDPPRGWVRFFAQEGYITLTGGTEPAKKEEKKVEPTPTDTPPSA